MQRAEETLTENHQWVGLSGRIGSPPAEFKSELVDEGCIKNPARCPWLLSIKQYAWGMGPTGVPLPGLPCFLQAINASAL
eukprot:1079974-Pyramimonas_sp.AAC.2